MAGVDAAQFASLGFGFNDNQANRYSELIKKTCVLIGVAAGVGLAVAAVGDYGRASRGHASPKGNALVLLFSSLGIGTMFVGGMCNTLKIKYLEHARKFASTEAALGALTPTLKAQLKEEALKLLSLEENILKLYEKRDDFSPDLIA